MKKRKVIGVARLTRKAQVGRRTPCAPRRRAVDVKRILKRPDGYFANAYNLAEIREDNRLAKASVIHPPKDLE